MLELFLILLGSIVNGVVGFVGFMELWGIGLKGFKGSSFWVLYCLELRIVLYVCGFG